MWTRCLVRAVFSSSNPAAQYPVDIEKKNIHSMKLAKESRNQATVRSTKSLSVCSAVLSVLLSPIARRHHHGSESKTLKTS